MIEKVQKFLISMLDPAGHVSFGRTMSMISLAACLSWDTANLCFAWSFNHHLPPGFSALPLLPDATVLIGQAGFCSTFYGVTKLGDMKKMGIDGRSSEEVEVKKG